jgi:hypothetical protein
MGRADAIRCAGEGRAVTIISLVFSSRLMVVFALVRVRETIGRSYFRLSQRAAASAVSSGRVLKAMDASGAHLCTVLMIASKNSKLLGGTRIPPPITMQS